MKRIMVVGCCGSGKSTLARKLHVITNLKLFHLDQYYWKPNWKPTEEKEWNTVVKELTSNESWIIDGNYKETIDLRIAKADTIIMLNLSTLTCLFRIIKRIIINWGKVRSDMPLGCIEKFDLEFLKYVYQFQKTQGVALKEKLQDIANEKKIIILESDKEIKYFIKQISENYSDLKD